MMSSNLIVYYSRRGQNYVNGSIRDLERGNTEIAAGFIRDAVGGDMFEIRTVKSYATDYHACTDEAKAELSEGARPELVEYLDDVSGYNGIFVCGPCWWGTYPMAVFSLLDRLDLDGKRLIPLMTHEGSGMGSSERDLRRMYPGADVRPGLAIHGADAERSASKVSSWAKKSLSRDRPGCSDRGAACRDGTIALTLITNITTSGYHIARASPVRVDGESRTGDRRAQPLSNPRTFPSRSICNPTS